MTLLQSFFPEVYSSFAPAYNLVKESESDLVLELDVLGFSQEDIDIELSENKLTVSARKSEDDKQYLYRGIQNNTLKRTFTLRDDMIVKDATVRDGILRVKLEVQIPEHKKPRKILITQ